MFARIFVFGLALFGLVGCEQITGGLSDRTTLTSQGIRTLSLLGGDVRVRGPEGYCVDQAASDARSGFAVIAGCVLLTDDVDLAPVLDGLITVQFGDEETASVNGDEEAFASFLDSDVGRSLLATSGDATDLVDMVSQIEGAAVLIRFEDTSLPAFAGTNGVQWRGFFDVKGRLTTVSVLSFDRAPLTQSQAEQLLVASMNELTAVNSNDQPLTDGNS